MSCYSRTLTNSIKITEHTHVVYMSRTSHPGFIVAARDFNVPVIALQAGSSDHSFNHGQALLKSLLVNRNAAEAKKVCESAGPSSVSCKDLQFWEVAEVTPEEQVHRFYEKEPEGTWRSGLNKSKRLGDKNAFLGLTLAVHAYKYCSMFRIHLPRVMFAITCL